MPSTAIRRFSYDDQNHVLEITFITDRRYRYFAVPDEVAQAFATAASKGRFFNEAIRDRFRFEECTRRRV